MLAAAATVFLYYTIWAIFLVRASLLVSIQRLTRPIAIPRGYQCHAQLLPCTRMGSQTTSFHPGRRSYCYRHVRRVNDHEGEAAESGKGTTTNSIALHLPPFVLSSNLYYSLSLKHIDHRSLHYRRSPATFPTSRRLSAILNFSVAINSLAACCSKLLKLPSELVSNVALLGVRLI